MRTFGGGWVELCCVRNFISLSEMIKRRRSNVDTQLGGFTVFPQRLSTCEVHMWRNSLYQPEHTSKVNNDRSSKICQKPNTYL